ncbi:MAG TPA: hypothetical protein VEJ16_09035 [Alphaproteobacteria bacterium]|nr:hypothetical protein [Alphaproteobacteria bacterium]
MKSYERSGGSTAPRVEIGHCYKRVGTFPRIWRVVEEQLDREGSRHFRLSDWANPANAKLVAERALANESLYRRVTTV